MDVLVGGEGFSLSFFLVETPECFGLLYVRCLYRQEIESWVASKAQFRQEAIDYLRNMGVGGF